MPPTEGDNVKKVLTADEKKAQREAANKAKAAKKAAAAAKKAEKDTQDAAEENAAKPKEE